jgi:xanthine dehydrogenase accessory factor
VDLEKEGKSMHNELYRMLGDKKNEKTLLLATIIDGDNAGEKALWLDGKLCCESDNATQFKDFENEILSCENGTIIKTATERIFCEKIGDRKKLVICGAGHVAINIVEIAKKVGFYVTVIDDRPYFSDNARAAGADKVICDSFEHALAGIAGGDDTYFVIVTRGHRYDLDCLRCIIKKNSAYIGMMGSRRRIALVKKQMAGEGVSSKQLEGLNAPIGLAINAETPQEIAVSVVAQLIQVKNTRCKSGTYDDELLSYLAYKNDVGTPNSCGILCTIVEKKGSAPRACGTKMLLLPFNKVIGTIGGGCLEGKVLEIGRFMMMDDNKETKPRLEAVDMTVSEAEDEGMVCGGTILVFLEKVPVYINNNI